MPTTSRRLYGAVALAFITYAALYIYRTSFVVDGVRYFSLADDQMISMRYAANLAGGHGLVWNAGGPRVEGFTNLAWVIYMAFFHLLGVPHPVISLCIEASGVLFLLVNLAVVRAIARELGDESGRVGIVAVILTAFYLPLDAWAFQGTEVSVLTLLVSWCAWLVLRAPASAAMPTALYVVSAASVLVRPDMIVPAFVVVLALCYLDPRRTGTHLLVGGGLLLLFMVATTMFRVWYFGDPLPNTYYLKMTGFPALFRITRGAMVGAILLLQLAPVLAALAFARRHLRGNRRLHVLLALFAAQLAYSVYVGGDAWEWWGGANRFISIAIPLLFLAAAGAFVRTVGLQNTSRGAVAGFAVASAMFLNLFAYSTDPASGVRRMLLVMRPLQSEEDEKNVRAALALKKATREDAVVAVTWAGSIPYFVERPALDLLGKTDHRVAHGPMHRRGDWTDAITFLPGHQKWDYEYSIRTRLPDVIQAPLWHLSVAPGAGAPEGYIDLTPGAPWYVRADSPRVDRQALR